MGLYNNIFKRKKLNLGVEGMINDTLGLLGDLVKEIGRLRIYDAGGSRLVEVISSKFIYGPYESVVYTNSINILSCIRYDGGVDIVGLKGNLIHSTDTLEEFETWLFENMCKLKSTYRIHYDTEYIFQTARLGVGEFRISKEFLCEALVEIIKIRFRLDKDTIKTCIYDSKMNKQLVSPTANDLSIFNNGCIVEYRVESGKKFVSSVCNLTIKRQLIILDYIALLVDTNGDYVDIERLLNKHGINNSAIRHCGNVDMTWGRFFEVDYGDDVGVLLVDVDSLEIYIMKSGFIHIIQGKHRAWKFMLDASKHIRYLDAQEGIGEDGLEIQEVGEIHGLVGSKAAKIVKGKNNIVRSEEDAG